MKLELILRLLDNDELSPEQINDIKDFLDDYVEHNQVYVLLLCQFYCFYFVQDFLRFENLFPYFLHAIIFWFHCSTLVMLFLALQDDFDEFSDVDELYSSLPLDKVESLEDLVTTGPLLKVIKVIPLPC